MNITPLGNRVLLKPIKAEAKTSFGILIPEGDQKEMYAKVVAKGPGRQTDAGTYLPIELKVGDKVLMPSYGFDELHEGKEIYLIGDASSIGCKIEK